MAAIINLEAGMPTVDAAMTKLRMELGTLRRLGVHGVKIIHGYGSTGSGGAIRKATRDYLREQLKDLRIKAFCPGECFGPFERAGRQMVGLIPAFRQDRDWGRQNDGVTFVVLR